MAKQDYRKDAETLFWVVLKLERVHRKLQESYEELIEGGHGVYFYQLSRERNFVNAKSLCNKIGVGSRAILEEIKRLDPNRLVKPIADATAPKLQKQEVSPEIKERVQRIVEQFERDLQKRQAKAA